MTPQQDGPLTRKDEAENARELEALEKIGPDSAILKLASDLPDDRADDEIKEYGDADEGLKRRWAALEKMLGEWSRERAWINSPRRVEREVRLLAGWTVRQYMRHPRMRRVWVGRKVLRFVVEWLREEMKAAGEIELRRLRWGPHGGVMFLGVELMADVDAEYTGGA